MFVGSLKRLSVEKRGNVDTVPDCEQAQQEVRKVMPTLVLTRIGIVIKMAGRAEKVGPCCCSDTTKGI